MQQSSDTIGKLATALVKARAELTHPTRNKVNPHFRNRYADLTAVLDAVTEAFTNNGLAIVQLVDAKTLVTILMHSSGEYISSAADIPAHNNAQQLGSALTYLRRYTVQALAGIAAEDDDDGNAASKATNKNNKSSASTTDGEDW